MRERAGGEMSRFTVHDLAALGPRATAEYNRQTAPAVREGFAALGVTTKRPTVKAKSVEPLEDAEQAALFARAEQATVVYPELALLHSIPNGAYKSVAARANFKRTGLKTGVPDICLPTAHGGYTSLYIELKRVKTGSLSDAQKWWLQQLRDAGCRAAWCRGADAAWREIEWYVSLPHTETDWLEPGEGRGCCKAERDGDRPIRL